MIFNRKNRSTASRPWYFRRRMYLALFLIGFISFTHHYLQLRLNDSDLSTRLSVNALSLKAGVGYEQLHKRRLRYVEIGHDSLPLIVFIHGAPSSSAFWLGMMTDSSLLSRAKLLAVDRPGYGFSGFGRAEISVERQAGAIAQLLRKKRAHHDKIIIHGSSYGGTVAARLAMDYPELVDGLLLQSASLAPGAEKTYWISYAFQHWLLQWLTPKALHVANMEKLNHAEQLHAMANNWSCIKAPTIILHGSKDWLIYPDNAYYACDRLSGCTYVKVVMASNRGHDLLWTEPDLLRKSLNELLEWKKEKGKKMVCSR